MKRLAAIAALTVLSTQADAMSVIRLTNWPLAPTWKVLGLPGIQHPNARWYVNGMYYLGTLPVGQGITWPIARVGCDCAYQLYWLRHVTWRTYMLSGVAYPADTWLPNRLYCIPPGSGGDPPK